MDLVTYGWSCNSTAQYVFEDWVLCLAQGNFNFNFDFDFDFDFNLTLLYFTSFIKSATFVKAYLDFFWLQ
jgi:hypothetical protein